jgi:hypothetical protein
MPKIKPGSRKSKKILKKRALKKRNYRAFIILDFCLARRKNIEIIKNLYNMPFSTHVEYSQVFNN